MTRLARVDTLLFSDGCALIVLMLFGNDCALDFGLARYA